MARCKRNAHVGDGQRVLDEVAAGEIVLACPIDVGGIDAVLDQEPRTAVAERIDHGRRSAAVAVGLELRARPVEISGMKEVREPIAHFLVRGLDRASERCVDRKKRCSATRRMSAISRSVSWNGSGSSRTNRRLRRAMSIGR